MCRAKKSKMEEEQTSFKKLFNTVLYKLLIFCKDPDRLSLALFILIITIHKTVSRAFTEGLLSCFSNLIFRGQLQENR